jgi:hypothetical protein
MDGNAVESWQRIKKIISIVESLKYALKCVCRVHGLECHVMDFIKIVFFFSHRKKPLACKKKSFTLLTHLPTSKSRFHDNQSGPNQLIQFESEKKIFQILVFVKNRTIQK